MTPTSPHLQRLLCSLALSVLLHGALVVLLEQGLRNLRRSDAVTPAALYARLQPPVVEDKPTPRNVADPLLKDTLAESKPAPAPPPPAATPRPRAAPGPTRAAAAPVAKQRAAQRKLAEHLFYPPEAVARGLEGETRLLLTLDAAGNVRDAEVASSSGHAILDQAAVKAAYAMGSLSDAGVRELILPVVFKLQ